MKRSVDLNVDAGESFGRFGIGSDADLFQSVSSANLACGFHAGDPTTMLHAIRAASSRGVAIGAHPGYPDLVGFGRRDLAVSPEELYADVVYQVGALQAMLRMHGLELHHVKAHGAMYLRTSNDRDAAEAYCRAVVDVAPNVPIVVLAGGGGEVVRHAAMRSGLVVYSEGFPDRGYLRSGELAPRRNPGSLVLEPERAAERAVRMVLEGRVDSVDGGTVELAVQTLCIHGDNLEAPDIARAIRGGLEAAGVWVEALGPNTGGTSTPAGSPP